MYKYCIAHVKYLLALNADAVLSFTSSFSPPPPYTYHMSSASLQEDFTGGISCAIQVDTCFMQSWMCSISSNAESGSLWAPFIDNFSTVKCENNFSPNKRPIQVKPFYRWSAVQYVVFGFLNEETSLRPKRCMILLFFLTMGVGDRHRAVARTGCRQSPEVHHTAHAGYFPRSPLRFVYGRY